MREAHLSSHQSLYVERPVLQPAAGGTAREHANVLAVTLVQAHHNLTKAKHTRSFLIPSAPADTCILKLCNYRICIFIESSCNTTATQLQHNCKTLLKASREALIMSKLLNFYVGQRRSNAGLSSHLDGF